MKDFKDALIVMCLAIIAAMIAAAAGLPYLRLHGMRTHGMYEAIPAVYLHDDVERVELIEL